MEKFKPEQLQFSDKAISHFSRMLEKEITKNSSWDSSPLVPEVDEIPF